jgi:hypothetical protein
MLIRVPAPAIMPLGCNTTPGTREDGSATLGYKITITDPTREVDPVVVVVVVVAPPLSPLPAQIKINNDADEEEDMLSKVETIAVSNTDLFLEEIAQDITVAKSNSGSDRVKVENHGADWVFIGPCSSNASEPTIIETLGLDAGS